jgi:MIF4G like
MIIRSLLIQTRLLATQSGRLCSTSSTYSKLTVKNVPVSSWSTQNGICLALSSPNPVHQSKWIPSPGKIGSWKALSLRFVPSFSVVSYLNETSDFLIQTVLGAFLILPESSHKSIYYIGLITELCKLSPSTVGPAVGKSIRKLYGSLADGLDVEVARRFAEWFAVHMSNFGFQWVWKEW